MSYWQLVRWRLRRDKVTLTAAAVLLGHCPVGHFGPVFWLHPILYRAALRKRLAPSEAPRGTCWARMNRAEDMLSRLLFGGRESLGCRGGAHVCVALLAGSTLGIVAGFMGGWVNMLIMRTMDIFYAFPSVLLAIAISGALGAGLGNTGSRAGHCLYTPYYARGREHHHAGTRMGVYGGRSPQLIRPELMIM